jgi:Fe-S-cluster containining protein
VDAVPIEWIERELQKLREDGSYQVLQDAALELRQVLDVLVQRPIGASGKIEEKLKKVLATNPWMVSEQVSSEIAGIANENFSVKLKRRKVIAIADRVTAALAPHVACKPNCSQCCHMNTVIYEHEAVRLAEVTGRTMVQLPFRPLDVVHAEGMKFNGKPCPFLVEHGCSVYEDRPLVCRMHHSLRDSAEKCSMSLPVAEQERPPMYNPDLLEVPYRAMNLAHKRMEPSGNIAEFFPD